MLLDDGTEAIALFGGEEEAGAFRRSRDGEGTGPTVRRTTVGGVLSLLYCPRTAKRVALDPAPEVPGNGPLVTPTLDRARFARRFAGVGGPEPRARPSVETPGIAARADLPEDAARARFGERPSAPEVG